MPERLPAMVADLVAQHVEVIVASGSDAVMAAHNGHQATPVVFFSADPNSYGVKLNFSRPDGGMTGTALMYDVLVAKWVQLMHELVPEATRYAVLTDGSAGDRQEAATIGAAAKLLSITTMPVSAASPAEFERAFATAVQLQAGAMIVCSSPLFARHQRDLIEFSAKHNLPAIYDNSSFVHKGGLLSYGPDLAALSADIADYVARILRGAKVETLPVQQPTKFVLALNARTARMLGLTIPPLLVTQAGEVIE
jgi:ABC-type uncharacterized transport system substrate-binding protein